MSAWRGDEKKMGLELKRPKTFVHRALPLQLGECRCFGGAEGAFEDGLFVALRL